MLHREAKPAAAEPWRRLSGIHAIRSPRNLAVARELWLARDARAHRARRRARPTGSGCLAPRRGEGDPADPARARRPARVQRPREPHRARPLVVGHRARAHHRPSSPPCASRATRRRRRVRGRRGTPRPTRASASRGRPSPRSPSSSTCPSRTCSRPITCVASRGIRPPSPPPRPSPPRSRHSVRARGRLRQPHRQSRMPLWRRHNRFRMPRRRFVGSVNRFSALGRLRRIEAS